ncbi:hypothetical protein GUJ93_ZPchr0014g47598 [Zizania palustris]|uniref:Uncharacterized protein n=1 Tax=Zizania palustris TaxID=103762 RepID=A0A8J5W0Q8_ZIZPA|nr:hypothetical protein GUJ93_ZPchr0014g47598 [Zizania palustris]
MSMPDRRSGAATSPSIRFLGLLKQPDDGSGDHELELDERDVVWSSSSSSTSPSSWTSTNSSPSLTPSASSGGGIRRPVSSRAFPPVASQPSELHHQSAPVAVPTWPKGKKDSDRHLPEMLHGADNDEDDDELVVPPHEMAARRAAAAASVMEGAGRTLKGRDLRRVRNAVWRTTGFLDL